MKKLNDELAKLLGIEPEYYWIDIPEFFKSKDELIKRFNLFGDAINEIKERYPNLTKPDNFVKLLEIKLFENKSFNNTIFNLINSKNGWIKDRGSFLAELEFYLGENKNKTYINEIKQQAQQTDWSY